MSLMNLRVLGFLGFQFWRENNFTKSAQNLKECRKVSEICVTDIYSEFVKTFHIQRGQTNISLMTRVEGARKFV